MPPAGLSELSILGGLLAGLASSLHCVSMCGGIASSMMLGLSPAADSGQHGRVLLMAQMGRITAYVLAGAALGALSSTAYFAFDRAEAHLLLRWLGGATLVYIGVSVAGWAPSLAGLDRLGNRVAAVMSSPLRGAIGSASPYLAGLVWGMMPCGMVYAVLLYAMLAGNPLDAGAIMLGFGLGTLPAVTAAAFGTGYLVQWAKQPGMRVTLGLGIAALGFLSVALPWKEIAALCGIPVE